MAKKQVKKYKKKKTYARTGKILTVPYYGYMQKASMEFAKTKGASRYGTVSAFINALICKERGVKPPVGLKGAEKKTLIDVAALKKTKKKKRTAPKKTATKKRAAPKKAAKKEAPAVTAVTPEATNTETSATA